MASRFTFGSTSGDLVTLAASSNSGVVKAAANIAGTGTFWSAQTGGTQYTDLVDPNNGFVSITGISTDANGRPKAFQGPAGVSVGWVDFGAGRFLMTAQEVMGEKGLDNHINDPGAALFLNPGDIRRWGCKVDGVTDDTANFNAALATGGDIYVPKGTCMINATANTGVGGNPVGLKMNVAGTRLRMHAGATLKAITNSSQLYSIIQVTAANCVIEGGTVTGDVGTHTGTTGEWGHGVDVNAGADRCQVVGVKTTLCWGDGIIIEGNPSDVKVINHYSDSNRRQGMSITNATRPQVIGGHFSNTGQVAYTGPGAGIDLEPDTGVGNVVDALLIGVTFYHNYGAGLLTSSNSQTLTGMAIGCRAISNGTGGATTATFYAIGASNQFRFVDCEATSGGLDGFATDTTTSGIQFQGCKAESNGRFGFDVAGANTVLINPTAKTNQRNGIYVDPAASGTTILGGKTTANSQVGNGSYINLDVQGSNSRIIGHLSDAGSLTNKPAYGITNRTGASGNKYLDCDTVGTYVSAPFLDQAANAHVSPPIGQPVGVPTAAAGANNGTTPPAPVVATTSRNHRGSVTFGSGTTPAAGAQCVVTYSAAYPLAPLVQVVPKNSATQALGLYVSANATGSFTVSSANAPTASQANTVYSFDFIVV